MAHMGIEPTTLALLALMKRLSQLVIVISEAKTDLLLMFYKRTEF